MDKQSFDDYKVRMAEYRKKMEEEGKAFFSELVKPVFEKYPQLERISWTQYTPYFNDGDPCTFSSGASYPSMKFAGTAAEDDDDEHEESYFKNDDASDEAECYRMAVQVLDSFDDDDYEMLFGDHARVILNPSGIEVEDYEHD